jgi:hypothetical protein
LKNNKCFSKEPRTKNRKEKNKDRSENPHKLEDNSKILHD